MKVLVTGGAGFIGSNFVEMFVNGEFSAISEIVILDSLTYAGNMANLEQFLTYPSVTFVKGDICDFQKIMEVAQGIDAVINFAAESHVDRSISSSYEFVRTNVLGVHNLLEVSRLNKIQRFIQVSTDEVYGSIPDGSWDEACPLLPNSPYSASKASADLLVRSYFVTYGLNVGITRCSNNYGSRQYPEKIIPFFVKLLVSGEKLPIYGSGMNVRDWLHVTDHCQGIYKVLIEGKPGEIYNIGGGTELTNLELVHRILSHFDLSTDNIEFVTDRQGHDLRYSVDWSKVSKIGYAPRVAFNSGLAECIEWYREQYERGAR